LSRTNAELARAARLKDEFLAGMSHELRTPLSGILGTAEILRTSVFGPLNEKQLHYLHNIEESGNHLLSLITDILDLAKSEAGKLELEIRPIAVEPVCQVSLRLTRELALKKRLKVVQTFDQAVTSISADERRLKQVLVNLLSNAIKFTPEGGQIGLEMVGDAEQHAVHFTVWDTGIGIAQEDMKWLFQPFVQIHAKEQQASGGTGLGLSLVARMIEMHGGGIKVESKVGQGSRFTVSLPWSPTEMQAQPVIGEDKDEAIVSPPQPATVVGEDTLVLLAEDNENNISIISDYLQVQGYRLVVARNGQEALERAHEERPAVVLMDIQMPGMDGLEATRRLRAEPALADLPIIAVTALAMPGDRERCLAAGVNEYLSKPVNLTELVRLIQKQLNHN
jgi:CheY-like chemotaxis protein